MLECTIQRCLSYLLDDSFAGSVRGLRSRSVLSMSYVSRWSKEASPESAEYLARSQSPSWMLSHWLLDRVIQHAERGRL